MNRQIQTNSKHEFIEGVKNAIPIFIGYFTTSLAFGILAIGAGLSSFEAIIFSMSNVTGAAQFMAINLFSTGAAAGEIIVSVALMNLRYFIMSASVSRKIKFNGIFDRIFLAFVVTDEVFSVASLKPGSVSRAFMYGLEGFSWLGWATGTIAGVTIGSFLSRSLQDAMSGALFALFAALLVPEIKKGFKYVFLALAAGGLNSILCLKLNVSAGWAIVISMLAVTAIGAAVFKDEEAPGQTSIVEAE